MLAVMQPIEETRRSVGVSGLGAASSPGTAAIRIIDNYETSALHHMKVVSTTTTIADAPEDDIKAMATMESSNVGQSEQDCAVQPADPNTTHHMVVDPDSAFDPPITAAMLRELDSDVLHASVQIRHDLLLEPMLKLRPNSHRRHSVEYKEHYRQYWKAMALEIETFLGTGATPHRLLRAIVEMRKLILACYPKSIGVLEGLDEFFDVDLLQHQLLNRSLPLVSLMQNVASILKQNCAPRRDKMVDWLVDLAMTGKFAEMLRIFFELMELMKLDLANYQLVEMRRTVEGSTVTVERDYFMRECKAGRFRLDKTKAWIGTLPTSDANEAYALYRSKVVELIILSDKHDFPETFHLDTNRIQSFRTELRIICISAAIMAFVSRLVGRHKLDDDDDGDGLMTELKTRLLVLVASSNTQSVDIPNHISMILRRIGKADGLAKSIPSLLDKLLAPESPLVQMIQSRLHRALSSAFATGSATVKLALREAKMGDWVSEVSMLYAKLRQMLTHHWTVYHPLYITLLNDDSDDDDSFVI